MRMMCVRFLIGMAPVMLFATSAFADNGTAKTGFGGSMGSMLPMVLIMFAIIYFMMIRPEQRKQKERQKLLAAMKKGDRVMTSAGIMGTVANVKETTVMVKIADTTIVEFSKAAVTGIINADGTPAAPEKTGK